MPVSLPLRDDHRAELYRGLGRALSAGLAPAHALEALAGTAHGSLAEPLARAARSTGKGTALPLALQRQGLLPERDRLLLTTADASGQLDRICERLADRHARRAARWRRMRGRLLLPAAVLLVAVVALPLPAVAAGDLPVTSYLLRTGLLLALLAAAARIATRSARRWGASGAPGWLTATVRRLPGLAALGRLQWRTDACERLGLCLASGLPAEEALDDLGRAAHDPARREELAAARRTLASGAGVAGALDAAGLLDASARPIVSAGEGAGRLEESLARVAAAGHDALDDAFDLLAQWIPVVLYFMVAGVVAAGLLA